MSAYNLQLRDARESSAIRKIAGVCSTGDQYRDYVNEANEILMNRGGWVGLEVNMRLCGTGCNAVFPRYVGTVLGLRPACGDYIQLKNHWWSILSPGYPNAYGAGWGTSGFAASWAGYSGVYGNYGGFRSEAIDSNNVPIFNQVSGNTGKLIRYHVVNNQDYGKTITLFGKKYGGQPLQQLVSGVTENGVTITAANPFAQTTDLVTKIDSVVREATVSPAYLYEYDPATTKLRMLASYEPGETNPSYRQMNIPNWGSRQADENGVCHWQIEALVKLEFIKAVNDIDFIPIGNFNALAMAIQSIRAREANDMNLSRTMLLSAIEELNFELRNKSPGEQFVVRVDVLGQNQCLQSLY